MTVGMMSISLSTAVHCITSFFYVSNIRGAKMPPCGADLIEYGGGSPEGIHQISHMDRHLMMPGLPPRRA